MADIFHHSNGEHHTNDEASFHHSATQSEAENYLQLAINPEERIRLIEENVHDYAIFVVDPQGRIASWNVGAARILGYSEAEVIGMNCEQIFTPEDQARGAVQHERDIARETGRAEDERWHRRKDGTRFWGSGIMTALRDRDGNLRGFVKILRDMTEHRLADRQHQEDLKHIAAQERQAAILEERNRLAREIHDTLAQGFTGITIQLEAAEDALRASPDQAQDHLSRARRLARESLAEARRSVQALRPYALAHDDLATALANSATGLTESTSLQTTFQVEGTPHSLPSDVENDLLRIAQEALTNIIRHAQANKIAIVLAFWPDAVRLIVQDDGHGFDPSLTAGQNRFGLLGMRERVQRMRGGIDFHSGPGQGTRVTVVVPVTPNAADTNGSGTGALSRSLE